MEKHYIKITEYCQNREIEESFVIRLEQSGLIQTTIIEQHTCIDESQLPDLERFTNWYYDLEINTAGIEALYHLLSKVEKLQEEVQNLKNRLRT